MELMLLGHVIGDFYIQTDGIAENKKHSAKYMLIHCFGYSVIVGIAFFVLNKNIIEAFKILSIIFLTHLAVDLCKRECDKRLHKRQPFIFAADQLVHVLILFLIYYIEKDSFCLWREKTLIAGWDARTATAAVCAMLICWKPAAVFVSLVFRNIPETVEEAEKVRGENIRIGYWIGVLEREIILLLGFMGQYGAIGFILTAKSVARFKQLENKAFAEKYLIGTLLSALIAIVCLALCIADKLA